MELHRLVYVLPLAMLGCCSQNPLTHASDPVPLSVALAVVEHDLHEAAPVTLTDLGSADQARIDGIKDAIFKAQCLNKTANPLVPVISGAFSLALQGSISQAGGATGTISATPSLALSYTITQGQQQQLTVPITFVAAEGLPNFYFGQSLVNLNGLSDTEKEKYLLPITANRAKLEKLINEQIAAYPKNISNCSPDTGTPPINPQIQRR